MIFVSVFAFGFFLLLTLHFNQDHYWNQAGYSKLSIVNHNKKILPDLKHTSTKSKFTKVGFHLPKLTKPKLKPTYSNSSFQSFWFKNNNYFFKLQTLDFFYIKFLFLCGFLLIVWKILNKLKQSLFTMNPSNPWLSPLSPEQIEIATGIQRELNDSVPYQRDLDNFEGQDGSSRPQFFSQNAVYSRQNPTSGLIQLNPQQLSSSYTTTNSGSHNQSIATSLNQMSPGSSSKSSKIFENSPSTSQSIHNSPIEYTTPGSIPQEEQSSDCEDDENPHTDKPEEDQDTTIKDPVHYCMTECRYQLYQTIMIDYLEDFKAWINVNRSMSEVHSFTAYLARDHQQLLSEITDMDRERYQYIISANEIITEFAKNALIKELNAPLPQNKQYWEGKLGMLQVLSSSTAVSQRTEIKDLLEEHTDLLINQTEKIQDLMDSIQERDEIIKNLVTQFDGLKSQFQSLMIKADKESRSKSMSPFTLGQASAPLSYQTPIKPALSVRSDCSSVSLHKGKQPLQSPETPTITVEQLNKLRDIIINDPNANVKYTALIRLGFSSEMAGNFADNWDHFSVKLCNKLNEITSPDELKPWILDLHQKFERAKYLQQ